MKNSTNPKRILRYTSLTLCLFISLTLLITALFHMSSTPTSILTQHKSQDHDKLEPNPWLTHIIQPGDTLGEILSQWQLSFGETLSLLKQPLAKQYLINLKPGQKLEAHITKNTLSELKYAINTTDTLIIKNDHETYHATVIKNPMTSRLLTSSATINSNLSSAATKAHLSPGLYKQLTDIFAGTVNFKTAIQPGDQFRILYKEYYLNNKKHHSGEILAAELTNKNHTYTAIRFTTGSQTGYYTPTGGAIQPKYLKYPVHYTRISSPFSLHRMDPVRHKIAPHLGTDLAAPTGTPIHSIGDGTVIFEGWSRGFGKTVIVRYNKHMKALYAHMSRFTSSLPHHVHKGEIIGYVGQTGWATGPHLHLGIYIDGKAVDPMTFSPPTGNPITKNQMTAFTTTKNRLLDKLNQKTGQTT